MKYAIFTGATGGLGMRCVKSLSETDSWTIFATGNNEAALQKLEQLKNVIPLKMDVTNQESIDLTYKEILNYTDQLSAIVNFAGLTDFVSLIEGDSIAAIERNLEVNLLGTARVNRTFFEMIYKGKGRIINCSSESGWMTPSPFAGPYVLSKHAVEAYSDSLRRELLYLNVPVIKIQPGAYDTRLTQQVTQKCDELINETKYYSYLLKKMKPMMMMELKQKNNPDQLVKVVLKAMTSPKPKLKYRVGTSKMLIFLEFFTDRQVDHIFKMFYGKRS